MKTNIIFLAFITALLGFSCNKDEVTDPNTPPPNNSTEWLIPREQVFDGGPGKDGIPAISNPKFADISGISYLNDNDLVIGYAVGNDARAYPHPILDWHEIINDEISGKHFSINYCPLTGTGIAWDRSLNGTVTTFGVSGLLYNTNLLPYDRATNSNWSQMLLKCVNGSLIGTEIKTYPIIETTWKTWKEAYPNSQVVITNTGFSRNYGVYPYRDYRNNNDFLLFPVSNDDARLPRKERVIGILKNEKAKVYSIEKFDVFRVIEDGFEGREIVVAGDKSKNFMLAFDRKLQDGTLLSFTALPDALPAVMTDNEGNTWDLLGNAISGPRQGQQLQGLQSYIGYFFAWAAFYPGLEIY